MLRFRSSREPECPTSYRFPATGAASLRSFVLPAITLSTGTMATLTRMTRSTMLEVIRADYVRTARAKGVGEKQIVLIHCLRNALLPIVTVIGVDFGTVLGGSVVIVWQFEQASVLAL